MIKRLAIRLLNEDKRGALYDILESIDIREINLLVSKPDSVRGGHYHKKTVEYIYVIQGTGSIEWKDVGKRVMGKADYKAGDLFVVEAMTLHTLKTRTLTRCMKFQTNDLNKVDDIHIAGK